MYQKNPAIVKGVDWVLICLYALLVMIGLLCIFSVEYRTTDGVLESFLGFKKNYSKQLLYFVVCIAVAVFIIFTDSKLFTATANISYLAGIVLILATFVLGKEIKGSKSWIPLGFINLQPVELCKIFTSLALAKYLSMPDINFRKSQSQLIAAAISFSPAVLSILQGETGLALVYFSLLIPMYREGLPSGYLITGFAMAILLIVSLLFTPLTLLIAFLVLALVFIYANRKQIKRNKRLLGLVIGIWIFCSAFVGLVVPFTFKHVFKPYQADRIFSMVGVDNPFADKNTSGLTNEEEQKAKQKKTAQQNYNVKQSKIAIGSGGFYGKGFLKGTQTQGEFVPEQHTDFIFTSVGENFGFWGSTLLMLLYMALIFRVINIAERQRSTFSRVYAYCVASIIFFHVAVNICVTIGLAPVIGITLPLLSYGGSSLLTFTILLFILIRLDADRQMILR